ncbi:hypothetical protein HHI36_020603 [Cryptolaemus montrouzieri]|uniref:BPTI/Kunitz inhibitor domain-containing protein n=1 Tax=Cryptolaemus montrouzieri TaxID=559131 RepID=A0ABD2NBE3_9CUCU
MDVFVFVLFCTISFIQAAQFTKDDCLKPVQIGPVQCKAAFRVFSWRKGKCQETIYGGCFPSKNNFKTLEQCKQVAATICSS